MGYNSAVFFRWKLILRTTCRRKLYSKRCIRWNTKVRRCSHVRRSRKEPERVESRKSDGPSPRARRRSFPAYLSASSLGVSPAPRASPYHRVSIRRLLLVLVLLLLLLLRSVYKDCRNVSNCRSARLLAGVVKLVDLSIT